MSLSEAIQHIVKNHLTGYQKFDLSLEGRVKALNDKQGDLQGYNCKRCKNKGWIYQAVDGEIKEYRCTCMETRHTLAIAKKSGIYEQLTRCKLNNFDIESTYQEKMLDTAKRFLNDPNPQWIYYGGQSGCGKTHICTAIFGQLIKRGLSARYITWRGEVAELKRYIKDPDKYAKRINEYKTVDVLYIDDLFKVGRGSITSADINVAFELFDYRYIHSGKITLISSELTLNEVVALDEAIGSRIREKCGEYVCLIGKDLDRNQRLAKNKIIEEN